ncbi:unnamed protein product [Bursaphelenchus xylophilus]|uniref:(pine wood nematode) hypothetical protein n=1 Tax=Bursaphelenchus xylophilus TaxID=6326 RepID=A0A811KXT6_BURXY|nr:unnamed protein product [Bursaphelenchus xylophilus]CAG9105970.1 unnamed protein product [Bursaphelenchus xylophilus]
MCQPTIRGSLTDLDMFSKSFKKMDIRFDLVVEVPGLLAEDLFAKVRQLAEVPIPSLFYYTDFNIKNPHVDYYLKLLDDLYYSKPDVPKYLLHKTIRFAVTFASDEDFLNGRRRAPSYSTGPLFQSKSIFFSAKMPPKLSDECVMYLLESFCDYDSLLAQNPWRAYHRMSVPLICRRYFFLIFNGRSYFYSSEIFSSIALRDHQPGEIMFGLAEETTRDMRLQTPLISFYKLVAITPEIEPLQGRDKYVVKVEGNNDYTRPLLKILLKNRIPAQHRGSSWTYDSAATEEFNDVVATDFSYPAHRLYGMPYQLSEFTSSDHRVFTEVKLECCHCNDYVPHIFRIKTKKLTMCLDNFICLPPMPHLVELSCKFGEIGLMINDGALRFYEEIVQKLFSAAPNLNSIALSCRPSVFGTLTDLGEDTVADFFRTLESTLDLFSKHFKNMDIKLDLDINLPHSLRAELDAKLDLFAEIPVPMLFHYYLQDPHVDYYLKKLYDLYYCNPEIPKHLLNKTIGLRVNFFDDNFLTENRLMVH